MLVLAVGGTGIIPSYGGHGQLTSRRRQEEISDLSILVILDLCSTTQLAPGALIADKLTLAVTVSMSPIKWI